MLEPEEVLERAVELDGEGVALDCHMQFSGPVNVRPMGKSGG
jgi:hypothetical protein